MKINIPICTTIYTHQNLAEPKNFFQRLKFRCEHSPELIPEKCGFWEPFKIKFSPDIIETLIPDDRGGNADSLYWTRAKKTKAWGAFSVPNYDDMHAEEVIHSELQQTDQNKLIEYVKKVCLEFDADLAIIDIEVSDSWNLANPHIGGIEPTTDRLRKWLPDMYWGVVFGKPYVDLWGVTLLLNTPAYKVEQLSDTLIFIQLTENVKDVVDDPEGVRIKREEVKSYLNNHVFYSPEKGYSNHDLWFFAGRTEDNSIWFPRLEYIPDIFNTPYFVFENSKQDLESDANKNSSEKFNQSRLIATEIWEVSLSLNWITQAFPEERPDVSTGTVDSIKFFYLPEYYDTPIEKELFIGAWDRPDQDIQTRQQFAESSIDKLVESFPTAYSAWLGIEEKVEHHQDYSIVYLDFIDPQEGAGFRITLKMIIFETFFVKVTFMDYFCEDLESSKEISSPIFDSFKPK